MRSAWIRGVGFFGAVALLAAACSTGVDAPLSDAPGNRALQITIGGASNVGGGAQAPNPGAGGVPTGTGGASGSASSSTTGGVGGTTAMSSASSSSSSVGVGGSTSSASSSSSSVGVGGSTSSASSSSSSVGVGGSTSGASSSSTGMMTKLSDGSPCFLGTDCQSSSCVDGVCCNSLCAGTCIACTAAKKGGGADGVCGPILPGHDPDSECAPNGICGTTGFCSGSASCAVASATTSCASCAATEGYVYPSLCDGLGMCGQPAPVSCGLYRCSAAACLLACAGDADCVSTAYCAAGVCTKKSDQGGACTVNNDCKAGLSCADQVCCDTACTGSCVACTAAKKGGGADGVCGNVAATTDPDNECPDPQLVPCQAPGFCNGNGACAPALPVNAVCANGSCTASGATPPGTCDNQGACIQGGTTPCPLGCLGAICKTTCVNDVDCLSVGGYCSGGNCVPKAALGGPCGGDSQCAVGSCVAGICCDAACNGGPCQTCLKANGALNDGTCTLLNGPPPAGKCGDGLTCTDDVCSAGACANPPKACPAPGACMMTTACTEATGQCGEAPLMCPPAAACETAGACDLATGLCAAPTPIGCAAASDACHVAATCNPGTGECDAETPLICPQGGIGVCETRVCDVTSPNAPCVVRSKLDGAKCTAAGNAGICVAGSCFTVTGTDGTGGAGGVPATSSTTTGASATTGEGGAGGEGGSGVFHFAGGACNIVNADETSLDGQARRLGWLLAAALLAARRRPGRAGISSRRGSRDA